MKFWVFDPPMMVGASAFAYPVDPKYGDAPRCPACGVYIGARTWLPPHRVRLIEGTRTTKAADVITGPGIDGFIASQGFVDAYERAGMKGVNEWKSLDIAGYSDYEENPLSTPPAPAPKYRLAAMPIPTTRAVWEEMHPVYANSEVYGCAVCGKRGRALKEYQGVAVDESSWTGADIFQLMHLGSPYVATEAFVEFVTAGEFLGVPLEPASDYVPSFARR